MSSATDPLILLSSIVSICDIESTFDFFDFVSAPDVDKNIVVDFDWNWFFSAMILADNRTDDNDTTPEQTRRLLTAEYRIYWYNTFLQLVKSAWSEFHLHNDSKYTELHERVRAQLAHLFDAGDEHRLLDESKVAYIDSNKVVQWMTTFNGSSANDSFYENVFNIDQTWELLDAANDAGFFTYDANTETRHLQLPEESILSVKIVIRQIDGGGANNEASWILGLRQVMNQRYAVTYPQGDSYTGSVFVSNDTPPVAERVTEEPVQEQTVETVYEENTENVLLDEEDEVVEEHDEVNEQNVDSVEEQVDLVEEEDTVTYLPVPRHTVTYHSWSLQMYTQSIWIVTLVFLMMYILLRIKTYRVSRTKYL